MSAIFETIFTVAERAVKEISGGDIPNDSPYDMDFVMRTVRDTFNEDVKLEILSRRGGNSDDKSAIVQAIYTYPDLAVEWDNVTKRCFTALPSVFMSLKYNKGIHSISKTDGSLQPFIRITNPGVTSHLPHANYETWEQVAYYVEQLTAYYMRDVRRDQLSKVMVKLRVMVPSTLGPDDPLPIIPENMARIVDTVKQRILNKYPQDRIADNDPNLRAANESRK